MKDFIWNKRPTSKKIQTKKELNTILSTHGETEAQKRYSNLSKEILMPQLEPAPPTPNPELFPVQVLPTMGERGKVSKG